MPEPDLQTNTFRVAVLGCKVNQYEAQQIRQYLEDCGWRLAAPHESPDLVVVHACAVTAEALRQSLQTARRASATSRVLISGCAAAGPFAPLAETAATAIVPAGVDWRRLLREQLRHWGLPKDGAEFASEAEPLLRRFEGHARAFVKVQDGCDAGCAYCIVPRLRGPPRDRPVEAVVAEARALAEAGHPEIVVTGVCIGRYGRDGGPNLAQLLRRLARIETVQRLRLSSLHPAELTEELLEVWRSTPKLLPHAHLPLQSGSDAVLRRMRRGYTTADFARAVRALRAALDRPAITTDVMVGFPGETEAEFEESLAFVREIAFSRMHVFRFSPRPGTAAAAFESPVAPEVARERAARMNAESKVLSASFHRQFVGETVEALAESFDERRGRWRGYDERYIPVEFSAGPEWRGRWVRVRIIGANADRALGEVLT